MRCAGGVPQGADSEDGGFQAAGEPQRVATPGATGQTVSRLPLERTDVPGIYRRGLKYVVIYRAEGRQRKQYVDTLAEARAIKLQRDGEARALRRGPTLHEFSLSWLDRYAGSGHDSVRESARREYCRLLNFALTYFDREVRVRDLDRAAVQHFVDWLTTQPGRDGRSCDRSIANALTPLRLALDAAVAEGLLDANPAEQVVLPRWRALDGWAEPRRPGVPGLCGILPGVTADGGARRPFRRTPGRPAVGVAASMRRVGRVAGPDRRDRRRRARAPAEAAGGTCCGA